MRENKDYKNEALAALKGHWAPSVLAVLVYFLIVVVLMVPYEAKVLTLSDPTDLEAAKSVMTWFWFYAAGMLLVVGPLVIGMVNAFKDLLLAGDDRVVANEFRIGFGRWLRHVWGYLLKGLLVTLWSLLFLIPGIIKLFSYAMTNYILVDYPNLKVSKAIALSNEMMKGHKYDLFYLYLGFAGWYLLSILTLGIGFFWMIPYAQVAQASFYQDVKAEWLASRAEPASMPLIQDEPAAPAPAAAKRDENPEDYMPR